MTDALLFKACRSVLDGTWGISKVCGGVLAGVMILIWAEAITREAGVWMMRVWHAGLVTLVPSIEILPPFFPEANSQDLLGVIQLEPEQNRHGQAHFVLLRRSGA